jgi:hypothetical protein
MLLWYNPDSGTKVFKAGVLSRAPLGALLYYTPGKKRRWLTGRVTLARISI